MLIEREDWEKILRGGEEREERSRIFGRTVTSPGDHFSLYISTVLDRGPSDY
jgi:hypothetical protein